MQKLSKLVATLFFIGYVPIASGTVASAVALAFFLLVRENTYLYLSLTAILLIAGFWSSSVAVKGFKERDPHPIVIDEFSSMFLAFLFVPFSIKLVITGFFIYRFFDITKLPPLKKLESLPGGWGIMLDDIASAILTNIVLQVLAYFPIFY